MNDVVAVALVTAGATLSAGAIAGAFTYGAARRQATVQERQAREARAEQRVVRHREVRRDIYVRFLNDLVDFHRYANRVWTDDVPPSWAAAGSDLMERAEQVGKSYTVLSLEGPPNVASAASTTFDHVTEETFSLKIHLMAAGSGGAALFRVHSDRYTELITGRQDCERVFVEAARKALGGHLIEPE